MFLKSQKNYPRRFFAFDPKFPPLPSSLIWKVLSGDELYSKKNKQNQLV